MTREGSGNEASGPVELLDGTKLAVATLSGGEDADTAKRPGEKSALRGAALLGYENTNGLRFLQETVKAEVLRADTGEVLGSGELPLRNQTPFSTDETMVYIPFSEPVRGTAQEDLEVRFSSEGLTRNGIFFSGQKKADSADAGEEGQQTVAARLYYEKKSWSPGNAVITWLLAAAAGLLCMLLRREEIFPLYRKSRRADKKATGGSLNRAEAGSSGRERGSEGDSVTGGSLNRAEAGSSGRERNPEGDPASGGSEGGSGTEKTSVHKRGITVHKGGSRSIAPLLLVLLLGLFVFGITYVLAIRRNVGTSSAEFLVPQSSEKDTVSLRAGETIRQVVVPGQDKLSGFGVRLKKSSDSSGTLVWNLLDESGSQVLAGGSRSVDDLLTISAVLPTDQQSEAVQQAAFKYQLLSLDHVISGSAGGKYILELSMEETPGEEDGAGITLRTTALTNGSFTAGDSGEESEDSRGEICLIATYKNNGFLKRMFFGLCAALLIMLTGLYFAAGIFRRRTAAMYLACALCMGTIFSFMTPAYTISDERAHIDSVYLVSNRLLGIMDEPGPQRIWKRSCDIDTSMGNTMPVTLARFRSAAEGLFGAAEKDRQPAPAYARTALDNVPLLCYLPAAVGFSIGRLIGRNLITMIMMARWANLLACALVIWLAVKRMPFGAAVPALIALFPKALQQISSCSYDGMIIAGIFFFTASCLQLAYDDEIGTADVLLLILSTVFTAACKGGAYLPLVGLVLIIPFTRAGQERKSPALWGRIAAASAGAAAFLFLSKYVLRLFRMFSRSSGSATILAGQRSIYTFSDLVHDPAGAVKIFMTTLHMRADGLLGEMVGKNLAQKWFIIYAFILLVLLAVLHRRGEKIHLRLPVRLWMIFLAFASSMLIFLSMLIAFTVKGATLIEGLQGRYFLPLAPFFFLAAENRAVFRENLEETTLLYAADVLLAMTFCEILIYYLRIGG